MSTARSVSSSAHRLTCQLLRTGTGRWAVSRIAAGVGRQQAQLQWQRGLAVRIRNSDHTTYTGARWFSAGGVWRQNANANANGDEFKKYGFEEITASLPTATTTTSSPSPILIDVREPSELLSTGIIPTSQNIPIRTHPDALFLSPDEFLTRFGFAKPDTEGKPDIVFYCKAGVRARAMAALAVQAGYDKRRLGVYDGSWLDWEKRGGPVERWEAPGEGDE